jgi:glutaredoxin
VTAVTLYSKPDCHLCDLAYQLLTDLDLTVSVIDIQSNPVLMEKYHLTIPVVLFSNAAALSWPFDTEAIQSLLSRL